MVGVAIIAIFYIGKSHAKASVENLVDLFSGDRVPQDIYALKDRRRITAMLIVNFLQFVALDVLSQLPDRIVRSIPVPLCILFRVQLDAAE